MAPTPTPAPVRSNRALAVGFLAWHGTSALVEDGLLLAASLAYAGFVPTVGELSPTFTIFGLSIPAWLVLAALWVGAILVSVVGVLFGIGALMADRNPHNIGKTIVLGRIMFAVCLLNCLLGIIGANAVSIIGSLITLVLTGACDIDIRRVETRHVCNDEHLKTPKRSFVIDTVENVPLRERELDEGARNTFRMLSGYSTIMLAWGGLRVLSGLSVVFSASTLGEGLLVAVGAGLLVVACGVYLIVTGSFGKRALLGAVQLRTYCALCLVGAVVNVAILVGFALWFASGWQPAAQNLFAATLDLVFYAAGLACAAKLERQLEAE